MRYLFFVPFVLLSTIIFSQDIVLNEFMSSNNGIFYDEDMDDSDWIEIFNGSDADICLSGWCLSDNENNIQKWCFPDTIMQSGSFLIVFASGKDRCVPGKELHTNFKVSAGDETLILSWNGTKVQSIDPFTLTSCSSYGLFPDGSGVYNIFNQPTPGYSNVEGIIPHGSMFSRGGGFYEDTLTLELNCNSYQGRIFYTIDGSVPTSESFLYSEPLHLNKSLCSTSDIASLLVSPPTLFHPPLQLLQNAIVIRAAVFNYGGRRISDVETHSFFIESFGINHENLPVISICTQYDDLFSDSTGIMVPGIYWNPDNPFWTGNYYNRGLDWERPVNVEFYEPNNVSGFNRVAGLRTHGGNMRRFPQKGFRIYARDEHCYDYFRYKLFDEIPRNKFKSLILVPFASSWTDAGVENYLTSNYASQLQIETTASRPVVLYMNGEYRGIYFIKERADKHLLENFHQLDKDSVDIIEQWWGWAECGDNENFLQLYQFVEQNDLSNTANYNILKSWIDVESFIDYQIFEIFIANYDWPANNMKCWRPRKEGARWRWIFFDGDGALSNVEFDGFQHALSEAEQDWPTNARSTLFLRKLIQNKEFYTLFISRLTQLLNNELKIINTSPVFQEIFSELRSEIHAQSALFGQPATFHCWADDMNNINNFLINRPCEIQKQLKSKFSEKIRIPVCEQYAFSISDIQIIPNPSNGNFAVSFSSLENGMASMYIFNSTGSQMMASEIYVFEGENKLSVMNNSLPCGLYLVTLQSGSEYFTARLMIFR